MPDKIAFVMPWFLPMPPVRGGAVETLVDTLLRENERRGRYEVTVYSIADEAAAREYSAYPNTRFVPISVPEYRHRLARIERGVNWKLFRHGMTPGIAYLRAVCKALRGQRYDAIIVENQAPFAAPISKLNAGPVYLHMHNVAIASEQPRLCDTAKACRRMIGVSEYISEWMTENMGGSPEVNRVLPNCVDSALFAEGRAHREETRALLGIAEDELVFLYAGRLLPEKGALELARAFALADIPGSRLVFVGSRWFGESEVTPYEREIQEALKDVWERVIFAGYTAYPDMPKYYAAADVAVLPSIWDEPSGLTVLEAQAAGVPLITTRSGGIPKNTAPGGAVILDRGEGLAQEISIQMRLLAQNPALREKMSRSALEWSAGRTPQTYFDAFCSILDED